MWDAIVAIPTFDDGGIPNFKCKAHWLSQNHIWLQHQQGNCKYSKMEATPLINVNQSTYKQLH
jgi:hypothetical protein